MASFFHPLIKLLSCVTQRDLLAQIQFLKAENEILRSKLPKRLTLTHKERSRLLKLGERLGSALTQIITIVSPRTFARWRAEKKKSGKDKKAKRKPGRPRTKEDVRELVIRLASENAWGLSRILGEIKKLRRKIGRTTIRNILIEEGLDPGPKRGKGTWHEFLKMHADTLWQCDFLQKKIWTKTGLRDYFVLFFIQIGSKRVFVCPATAEPNQAWVNQQARNFQMFVQEQGLQASYLVRDNDSKFIAGFDDVLGSGGIKVVPTSIHAPNMDAFAERWCQSLQVECLDHFVILGEKHLNYLAAQYVAHFEQERPHQSLGNVPPLGNWPAADAQPQPLGKVVCHERLGGLLKHYSRAA